MMASKSAYQREVCVDLTDGLHLRPLSLIAKQAMQFSAEVTIAKADRKIDAKSTIDLLTLEANYGTELIIGAKGEDAEAAVNAIVLLFESGFPVNDESSSV